MAKSRKTDKGRFRDKRGTGTGKDYKPWLKRIEISGNKGRSHRPLGMKTGRHHELFSDLEYTFFLLAEWDDNVIDIQEQYPLLPIEQTEMIADELSVKHPSIVAKRKVIPKYKHSSIYYEKENIVMTTDFLLTMNDGTIIAKTIKSKADLKKKRTLEKLIIESKYWELRGIMYEVITDEFLLKVFRRNLSLIRGGYIWYKNYGIDDLTVIKIKKELLLKAGKTTANFTQICRQIDKKFCLEKMTSMNVFRLLLWTKDIKTDLNITLDFTKMKIETGMGDNIETINFKRCS